MFLFHRLFFLKLKLLQNIFWIHVQSIRMFSSIVSELLTISFYWKELAFVAIRYTFQLWKWLVYLATKYEPCQPGQLLGLKYSACMLKVHMLGRWSIVWWSCRYSKPTSIAVNKLRSMLSSQRFLKQMAPIYILHHILLTTWMHMFGNIQMNFHLVK